MTELKSNYKLRDQEYLSDAQSLNNQKVIYSDQSETISSAFNWLNIPLFLLLLAYPLWFGGVHPKINLTLQFVICILSLYGFATSARRSIICNFFCKPAAKVFFTAFALFSIYIIAQNILLSFDQYSHPVLGRTSSSLGFFDLFLQLKPWLVFGASVLLWLCLLYSHQTHEYVLKGGLAIACLVACVALSHWFYDNGRLFWIFSPTNIFVSDRARWPFVNANHLAAFLLPWLFLSLTQVILSYQHLVSRVTSRRFKNIIDILSSGRVQRSIFGISLNFSLLLILGLAVVASLSRASWLAASLGLLLMIGGKFLLDLPSTAAHSTPSSEQGTANESRVQWLETARRRRSRTHRKSWMQKLESQFKSFFLLHGKKILNLAGLIGCLLIFSFFLNQRGNELLQGRIEYALANSLDDARWLMFQDTWRLFSSHSMLGIGLGNWSQFFPAYARPSLAGIDPVYLHSDPYQLLVEAGPLGFALIAGLFFALFMQGANSLRQSLKNYQERIQLLGLMAAWTAFLTACCFDFPWRIPGVTFTMSLLLAYLIFMLDSNSKNQSSHV